MAAKYKKGTAGRLVKACGGASEVARICGEKNRQTVQGWVIRDKIPPKHTVKLCRACGGLWQPHQVSPDVFDESQSVPVTA